MNFHLCYVCAGNLEGAPPPEHYREGFHRFCRTIREFAPLIGREEEDTHWRVVLINSNGGLNDDMRRSVGFPFTEVKYDGKGWDIGAQQFCAQRLPLDEWMVCFSSWAYFTFDGWLDRYVTAVETNGDALYGSMTSHEAARTSGEAGIACGWKVICNIHILLTAGTPASKLSLGRIH